MYLLFCFFLAFSGSKAQGLELISQNDGLLKTFVNKNSVALRSVQKNLIKNPDALSAESFKELLKFQLISVKQYQKNNALSTAIAYKLRESCIAFLSKNSSGSIDYFKITDEEKMNLGSQALPADQNTYFSESEIRSINEINIKDPALFNAFTITLQ